MNAEELRFTKTHEWIHIESDSDNRQVATVGISAFAVEALTDLVFIELPDLGRSVSAGDSFSEVESVKAVSDIYSPVTGEVVSVNDRLSNAPESLSADPYGEGWIAKIRIDGSGQMSELMDYGAYQKMCEEAE